MYPVYRQSPMGTGSAYPENLLRTMAPQIFQLRRVVGHHFKNRHKGHRDACRNWVRHMRSELRSCGWNAAAIQVNSKQEG